jgi:hypothetical protein
MREITGHLAGKIFLLVLLVSVIVLLAFVATGAMEETASGPFLLFGWITAPLAAGVAFVLVWLVAYLIYFFKFWPFR